MSFFCDEFQLCANCAICKGCEARAESRPHTWSDEFDLCLRCFELYQKGTIHSTILPNQFISHELYSHENTRIGNWCAICGKTYTDDDFEATMIQCTQCRRWLHSHCESLSALEYQLLSNLPDDTPYVCLLCSAAREPSAGAGASTRTFSLIIPMPVVWSPFA